MVARGDAGDPAAEGRTDASCLDDATCLDGTTCLGADSGFPPAERYEITEEAADLINERRASGGRILVVGTSALRTLETATGADGRVPAATGLTRLRITPGHRVRACDAFMTNLHEPRSSELVLAAALTGRDFLMDTYRHELVPRGYRFNYFGDSMLVT
ncbi:MULTISPECIES: S-adenosylmethionine:tRNA ribosyltransferase-isomerase [Kitasatospora]|uniref:S-adenosylmethionine:tRNA ribosyltransferase-isomerase n=1 Tax=Kitasatospora TaxID=2063 RepID=UPI00365B98F7